MAYTLFTLPLLVSYLPYLASATSVWTVNCAPLTQALSDPILSPGTASTHVHAVVGSTAFRRRMPSPNTAAEGSATTCDKATDHSNYWAPSAYHARPDGKYALLEFTGMVAYYTNYTCSYSASAPGYCEGVRDPIAPPQGLRMIAGDSARRSIDENDLWQAAILMESGNDGEVYGLPTSLDGDRLSGHARFPSCWDGENLDSADHRSHVSYPDPELHGDTQGGMCPASHPVALINIGAEFGYALDGITDPNELVLANGDTTGYGFHAYVLSHCGYFLPSRPFSSRSLYVPPSSVG